MARAITVCLNERSRSDIVPVVSTGLSDDVRSEGQRRAAMEREAKRILSADLGLHLPQARGALGVANTVLVVLAALLAAAAGATVLASLLGAVGCGLLALAAAAPSGVASALGAANRAAQYTTSAASDSGLADAARVFRTTVVNDLPIDEVGRQFDQLCKRRDTVVNNAPISGRPSKVTENDLGAWPPGAVSPESNDGEPAPALRQSSRSL